MIWGDLLGPAALAVLALRRGEGHGDDRRGLGSAAGRRGLDGQVGSSEPRCVALPHLGEQATADLVDDRDVDRPPDAVLEGRAQPV
jgi:hypothetical protein